MNPTNDPDIVMSWIIFASMAALIMLGVLAYWVSPAYENGVWFAFGAFSSVLSAAAGAKFGITIPGTQKPPLGPPPAAPPP